MIQVEIKTKPKPRKAAKTYRLGDTFLYKGVIPYFLTRVSSSYVTLTNLKDGDRWHKGATVISTAKITEEDLRSIAGQSWPDFEHRDFKLTEI